MGPYTKKQNSDAIDDGWTITDGDGEVIAHLDTETMADGMMASLEGYPVVVIEVSGGVVQNVFTGARISVVLVDFDNIEDGDDAVNYQTRPLTEMSNETQLHYDAVMGDEDEDED